MKVFMARNFPAFLILTFVSALLLAPVAKADPPIHFYAELSPDEESFTTESKATGHGDFTLDRDTLKLSWRVQFKDLGSAPTGAHIHGPQRPGNNSNPVFDLAPSGLTSPLIGSVVLNDGQLQNLLAGRYYVNIMTANYKEGELRGQIERFDDTAAAPPQTN
jgi:hypothetical protein